MIEKNDVIEIEFTGRIKSSGEVFDTTNYEIAKQNNILKQGETEKNFGPVFICVGQKQILPKLDEFLIGKEINKEYTLELDSKDAFGPKKTELIQTFPLSSFKKNNISPFPGLIIDADGLKGIVKTVSGGRVLVDFNYPIAGHDVVYTLKILRKVDEIKEKTKLLIKSLMGIDSNIELNNKTLNIMLELPKDMLTQKDLFISETEKLLKTIIKDYTLNIHVNNSEKNKQENKD